mmetsp:Transcript_47967/g.111215  ORF Transcript_47967/g.111215 Transcript_47967/m.111215 type:complete len:482 (-) Transcript_47967:82-1527(-)|eukprot:CAMPEP_0171065196 /NCGR_PEP_ID=MMETSP0766_2-20121228/6702_1 /TAXON_ID=439317 /ORGANISM="Gambierdiscus australes, Strain CAWD 149" /LENGTH=481 /DNA_ID=CAMNT_0011521273 /DNA_START=52 /DNA_END=1497 /DNA_ORIENTATION=+
MASALKVSGRQGRHELINGTYEPMGESHNERRVWVSRAVQPVYIFHTGKSRWVISKRVDDGSKCYAFLKDTGTDPAKAKGFWICCDQDGEWRADANVAMTPAHSSGDKFVQLRLTLDSELQQLGLTDLGALKAMWKRLDVNDNGIVSLAEVDKLVVELVAAGTWPAWLNNKPALMRAYKKTILHDGDGDDWVEKGEFHALLLNIFWFNKLWKVFEVVDSGADRRIDAGEFARGLSTLGLHLSQAEAQEEFERIDGNRGGQVLFVEFCAYVRERVNPDVNTKLDADIVSGERCGKVVQTCHGSRATHTHFIRRKSLAQFDELERRIKALIKDTRQLRELWGHLDFNGNNIVSLAEIDKLVVERYPLLNHKPALMRAYKATMRSVKDDDWVEKREFKALLGNLFYFNKLFWLFTCEDADHDRRLGFTEFKKLLSIVGAKMSEAEARQDFNRVDRNGGGIILFDEFCKYFTQKACPECLSALVD